MSIFQNTCKPEGFAGKLMLTMMNTGHAPLAAWGFQHISVRKDDLVLDIGCGGGANVRELVSRTPCGKVTGIDYSQVSVEKSSKLNQAAIQAGRCAILHGNVMDLPFADASFHLATAFETIYFWPDITAAFANVHRVLNNGGSFMICNESDGKNPSDEKWVKKIDGMATYTADQLCTALEAAGFRDIRVDENPEKHWLCIVARKTA